MRLCVFFLSFYDLLKRHEKKLSPVVESRSKCVYNRIKINVSFALDRWKIGREYGRTRRQASKREMEKYATSACATTEIQFSICVIHDARKSHLPIVVNITTHCSDRNLCVSFSLSKCFVSLCPHHCVYFIFCCFILSVLASVIRVHCACLLLLTLPFWPFASFDPYQKKISSRLVHIITATAFRHKSIATNKAKSADQHQVLC